jgi:SpoVK/Ycf46/Vps4 family AAA+-type ATPase
MIHSQLTLLTTDHSWNDWMPDKKIMPQVQEISNWLKYSSSVKSINSLNQNNKKGFSSLFIGPPGSGKRLTAALIGKEVNKPVYKVDLSAVVSKYIGETEKNLDKIFDAAEKKNWILFFDEADALFGKRTEVKDSHDRYANQEISYLLQRLENYQGLSILATNMKNNIDDAFIRRFNVIVRFK